MVEKVGVVVLNTEGWDLGAKNIVMGTIMTMEVRSYFSWLTT